MKTDLFPVLNLFTKTLRLLIKHEVVQLRTLYDENVALCSEQKQICKFQNIMKINIISSQSASVHRSEIAR